MQIPCLSLKTIIASQSETTVFQCKLTDLEASYPALFAECSAREDPIGSSNCTFVHSCGLVASVWRSGVAVCRPPKCAVKVLNIAFRLENTGTGSVSIHPDATAQVQCLIRECFVMKALFRHMIDKDTPEHLGMAIPIGLILFREADNMCVRFALVQSYVKACPLQNLFYRYPHGITTTTSKGVKSIDFCRDVLFQVAKIFIKFSSGVNGLFLYRDLKLPNVLVDSNGRVTIVDFGHTVSISPTSESWRAPATAHTSAPELLLPLTSPSPILADLFSFGVLAYEWIFARRIDLAVKELALCTDEGVPWWQAKEVYGLDGVVDERLFGISSSGRAHSESGGTGYLTVQLQAAKDLISLLLTIDPAKRVMGFSSSTQAHSPWELILKHPFFEGARGSSDSIEGIDEDLEDEIDMQTLGM